MKAPCEPCAAPYGFHNHMKLSENVTHFLVSTVNNFPLFLFSDGYVSN